MTSIDSTEIIRELQNYLRAIALYQNRPASLQVTGRYDQATRSAVEAFQKENGLPVTGDLDLATWEAVTGVYQRIITQNSTPIPLDLFPSSDFLLGMGSSGRLVQGIQMILQSLSEKFHNIPAVQPSGTFDDTTRRAVRLIQEKSGLEPTGIIDALTWNRIAWLYNFTSQVVFNTQIHET